MVRETQIDTNRDSAERLLVRSTSEGEGRWRGTGPIQLAEWFPGTNERNTIRVQ